MLQDAYKIEQVYTFESDYIFTFTFLGEVYEAESISLYFENSTRNSPTDSFMIKGKDAKTKEDIMCDFFT